MKIFLLFISLFLVNSFGLTLNKIPKELQLKGKNGGDINAKAWSSKMLKGKVHTLIYIDLDYKDDMKRLLDLINARAFKSSEHKIIAIINLASTWMPNSLIKSKLKANKMPNILYVFDKNKYLVKNWNLKDNKINVLIFDKKGILIYQESAKFNTAKIQSLIKVIKSEIEKN